MSPLSSDILHQVFQFFVSNNQIVDGESLRAASLVCRQWRDIVDSRSLWATPTNSGVKESNIGNDNNRGDSCFHTVQKSLQIIEQIGDPLIIRNSLKESLIGFVNLKYYGNDSSELYFYVRERATGTKLLLSISRDGQKNPSLIRDVYINHFELKGDFLLRDNNKNNEEETFFPIQRFPLGITVWKGRVIRWYRSGNETEARETIDLISPTKRDLLFHEDLAFTEREKNFSFVRHLFALENDSSRGNRNDGRFYAEGRQHMLDWMVEIAECFALEDRTIFQSMLLFDRFITSYDRLVSTSSFQLVAGACLLIASKCNKVFVTEKDISFCCDNIFSVANVIATEEVVLKHLEWKLACPSSIEFVLVFFTILGIDKDTRVSCLCSYILELSLAFHTSLKYTPSTVAASSMVLAFYCLRDETTRTLWPDELADVTGLELKDLTECSVQLSQDVENVRLGTSRLDMIHRRHSKACRHNAAEIPIPVLTSETTLTAYETRLRNAST